jgi:hypothetical protein
VFNANIAVLQLYCGVNKFYKSISLTICVCAGWTGVRESDVFNFGERERDREREREREVVVIPE